MLIVGNWKMNGLRADSRLRMQTLLDELGILEFEVVVAPPATLLTEMSGMRHGSSITLAAQDCHTEASGAFTGSISAEMLADCGCSYVIVGHSERRSLLSETDALVRAKAIAAGNAGCTPIICVGETEAQYRAGQTQSVLEKQLSGSVPHIFDFDRDVQFTLDDLIVAYEPVWAIGTGLTPSLDEIATVHRAIIERSQNLGYKNVQILYGGSVKPSNAADILSLKEVSGALVGGASLDANSFLEIIRAAT